jgi:hypothetical protein
MESKNFKKEKIATVERISDSDMNIRLAEEIERRLDLRKMDAKVVNLIEAKKEMRKRMFDKGLF